MFQLNMTSIVQKILIILTVILTPSQFATSFTQSRRVTIGSRILRKSVLSMSERDGSRGDNQFSSRGGGRFTSGGRGRGRGRSMDFREGFSSGTEPKLNDITYDSTTETEVTRLYAAEDRVSLSFLSDGQKLRGRIVSVKEFGMFVDVGAKRDGLVHVKDISRSYFISNHQSKFIPGQDIDVWVKFVEAKSFKLSLQMFQPEAEKASVFKRGSGFGVQKDDDHDDDTDDEEEEDDDDDEDGEELEADEIRALISGRKNQPLIVVEEFRAKQAPEGGVKGQIKVLGRDSPSTAVTVAQVTDGRRGDKPGDEEDTEEEEEESEEISIEEVFQSLCGAKDHLTPKDLKAWDYVEDLMRDGDLSSEAFGDLFHQAGSKGKLSEEEFDDFIDLLADHLGLEEEGSSEALGGYSDNEDDEGDEESEGGSDEEEEFRSLRSDGSSDEAEAEADEQDFGLGADPNSRQSPGSATVSGGRGALGSVSASTAPSPVFGFVQFEFSKLCGERGTVDLEDFKGWVFVQNLVNQGSVPAKDIPPIFSRFSLIDGTMDVAGFNAVLEFFSKLPAATEDKSAAVTRGKASKAKSENEKEVSRYVESSEVEVEAAEVEEAEVQSEEVSVERAFKELAGKRKIVTLESLIGWDIVAELLQDGALNTEDLKELCKQAGGKKKVFAGGDTVHLTFANFEELLDLLAPLAGGEEDDEADEELLATYERAVSGSEDIKSSADTAGKAADRAGSDGDAEEDEQELLSSVFKSLAGQKAYVAPRDLLDWDIVLELMGEGLLTDDLLREKMTECVGYNGRGVGLLGFDQLVDKLVDLYGKIEDDEEDEDDDDADVEGMTDDESEDDNDEIDDDDDDSYIDIDTEVVFEEVSKGKDFVTFEDFKGWEFIKLMLEADEMSEERLRGIIESAGVTDSDRMDILAFEAVLDELTTDINGDYEEEEEEEE